MPVFRGNTTGSVLSAQYRIPTRITSINLVDKSGSSNTVIVAIVENGEQCYIRSMALSANEGFHEDVDILLLQGFEVLVIASGSLDYYITVD